MGGICTVNPAKLNKNWMFLNKYEQNEKQSNANLGRNAMKKDPK